LTVRVDPEGRELKELKKYATFRGKEVLEVGCGEGRLTFQYAAEAKRVTALDASGRDIAEARRSAPKGLANKLKFRVGRGESLHIPDNSVDLVFFSWSLCCTDVPAMGKALDEAWRVLRRRGTLLSIQPSLYQPFRYGMIDYLMDRNSAPTIEDEGEKQARLALRHASLVEGKFDFVGEEEFPTFTYYGTVREFLREIRTDRGQNFRELDRGTKLRILEIIDSMKTGRGVRVQENAILTALGKVIP